MEALSEVMEPSMTASGEIKDLNKSPYHLLRRAWQFAGDLYAQEVGQSGLTHRQFTVLLAVEQNEGASQTDLVSVTGIDRSTLADLISRLIKRGYLQRRRTKEDARANSIRLSAAGGRALRIAQPGALAADRKLLRVLPPEQRRQFVDALMLISEALEEHLSEESDDLDSAQRNGSASGTVGG